MSSKKKSKGKKIHSDSCASEYSLNEPCKKPKMRTATDVISRLLWDEALPKEKFFVGYLDRFIGIVEKPFTSLDWSDPAIVDYYTLALPKHRIQYFKYRNKKVWDKIARIDKIFGSTGDLDNIHEFMQSVDEEDTTFFEEFLDEASDNESSGENAELKVASSDAANRPNYFIAARITNEEVLKNLSVVAESIKVKDPTLAECCLSTAEYHITLATMQLNSVQEITSAAQALNIVKYAEVSSPAVSFQFLNGFRHRVLYSSVRHDDELIRLRENLIHVLAGEKIDIVDKFRFVPHVTILKLSRPTMRERHSRFLDEYLYSEHEFKCFGSQVIKELTLCEMGEKRRYDGYYKCAAEIELGNLSYF